MSRTPRSHDNDDALPLEYSETDKRRHEVARMLSWGVSTREMARTLKVSEAQIRRDLDVIQQELRADAILTLGDRIRSSVGKRKMVQFESMALFHRLGDNYARDKVAALTTYLTAQDAIDRLEGTSAPDAQHAAAIAEAFDVMMYTLLEVGGQEMQRQFLEGLQRRNRAGTSALLLGARDADAEQLVEEDSDAAADEDTGTDGPVT